MQPLISVVVPVYNVEKWLNRCVASIVAQSYGNLQIILVDDGSVDTSGAQCDQWACEDRRIQAIHKPNGGLSDARNVGLAAAKGEYIAFVDSDDYIHPDFLQVLWQQLDATGSDIACCNTICVQNTEPFPAGSGAVTEYNTLQACSALIDGRLRQVVWNKLYKRSVLQDVLFPVGKYHEDEFWSYPVFARAKRVILVDFVGYGYFQHPESIMGKPYTLKNLDGLEAKCQRQRLLEEKLPALARKGKNDLVFFCMYHGQKAVRFLNKQDKTQAFYQIRTILQNHPLTREDRKQLTLRHRLWCRLMGICPVLTCRLRNRLGIGL